MQRLPQREHSNNSRHENHKKRHGLPLPLLQALALIERGQQKMSVSSECAIEALGYDIDLTCLSETIDLFGGALEEIRHPLGDVRANEIRRPIPPERRAFLVAFTQRLRLAADQKRKKRPFVPDAIARLSLGILPGGRHSRA